MKILFTRFPLESALGGAETQVLSLMEGLRSKGHEIRFLGSCPTLLKECKRRGIPANQLTIGPPPVTKWGAISFLWRQRKMRRLLEMGMKAHSDVDAVVMLSLSEKLLMTLPPSPDPFLQRRKGGQLSAPPSPTERGAGGEEVYWLEHDRVGRWLTKNPWLPCLKKLSKQATTIVVSELSKKIYLHLGFPEDKVVAIPNGIDLSKFKKYESKKLQTEDFHIGCISRLSHEKGVDLLVDAIKEIPNAKLTIVGKGRDEEKIKKLILNSQLSILNLSRVDDLNSFYNSLDLLVLPSREHDPFGLVAAEAMVLGVPVVVTDQCGIADYLEDGKDAIIVEANSANQLKAGILRLIADEKFMENIAREGQRTAKEKFGVEEMVDKYVELLIK